MSKYDPLSQFLKAKAYERVPMTFREIENLINDNLPASARIHRAWWSNNPSNSVITKAWLDAGYITKNVDLASEKLVFSRAQGPNTLRGAKNVAGVADGTIEPKSSIFGCMKGTMTVLPGVDLTEPADPEWGEVYDDD